MDKEPKALVELVEVLAVSKEGKLSCGKPFVNGAKIEAEVINEGRGKKVITFKNAAEKTAKPSVVLEEISLVLESLKL